MHNCNVQECLPIQMLTLVRGVDQYSWISWHAVDQNQDCWTAVMTVLLLKTLTQKMLVFNVNYVSTIEFNVVI